MTNTSPREFWIKSVNLDDFILHTAQADEDEFIHVIEFSAVHKLQEQLAKARAQLFALGRLIPAEASSMIANAIAIEEAKISFEREDYLRAELETAQTDAREYKREWESALERLQYREECNAIDLQQLETANKKLHDVFSSSIETTKIQGEQIGRLEYELGMAIQLGHVYRAEAIPERAAVKRTSE